jgi:hypothetical protein
MSHSISTGISSNILCAYRTAKTHLQASIGTAAVAAPRPTQHAVAAWGGQGEMRRRRRCTGACAAHLATAQRPIELAVTWSRAGPVLSNYRHGAKLQAISPLIQL